LHHEPDGTPSVEAALLGAGIIGTAGMAKCLKLAQSGQAEKAGSCWLHVGGTILVISGCFIAAGHIPATIAPPRLHGTTAIYGCCNSHSLAVAGSRSGKCAMIRRRSKTRSCQE